MSMMGPNAKRVAMRQARLDALGLCPPWTKPFKRRAWNRERARIMTIDVSELSALLATIYDDKYCDRMMERSQALHAFLKGRQR